MGLLNRIHTKTIGWQNALRDLGLSVMFLWTAADVARIITGAPMRSVSEITPQLHIGGQYRRRGWPKLSARGIEAVVNLRTEFDDSHAGIAPARYLHLPTVDNEAPTMEQLRAGVDFIAAEIALGNGVYVHCRSGVGRAATLVAAYLVSTGMPSADAWAQIREARPFIYPNAEQMALVERFANSTEPTDGKDWRSAPGEKWHPGNAETVGGKQTWS